MPALVWCGRRWLAGSDDFVFGSYLHSAFNITAAIIWVFYSDGDRLSNNCSSIDSEDWIVVVLKVLMGLQFFAALLFFVLGVASARGRVLEPSRRGVVPILLYCCVLIQLLVLAGASAAIHALFTEHDASSCDTTTSVVLKGLSVLTLLVTIWFWISLCMYFDPSGTKDLSNKEDYAALWEKRCRIMCCCFMGNSMEERGAYVDAAKTMTLLFQGLDMVPTDIMAGFVLLQGYQERVARRRLRGFEFPRARYIPANPPTSLPTGSSTRGLSGTELVWLDPNRNNKRVKISAQARTYHQFTDEQIKTLEKIENFARFYVGAYGHLLYLFQRLVCGSCILCATDPCACCRKRPGIHVGDCCMCNNTSLHVYDNGAFKDEEIIMSHFKNELYQPNFFIAKDKNSVRTPTICIAVRGTMSMQDCMTDGVASPQLIEVEGIPDAMVHSGMLKSAMNIKKAIDNHLNLEEWLNGHDVVVVGHSLGAGTAIVLTIVLREYYGKLGKKELAEKITCIGYAPPGGLMSRSLAESTRHYVVGTLMGKDLIPRLSAHNMHNLREALLSALATSEKSKSTTLFHCCCPSRESLLSEEFDASFEEQQQLRKFQTSKIRVEQRGSQARLLRSTSSSIAAGSTAIDIGGTDAPLNQSNTSTTSGSGQDGRNSRDEGPGSPLGGHARDEDGAEVVVDPKNLTEDGIVKMYPPVTIVHYAKADSDLCCGGCPLGCSGSGCRPCNTDHYVPCWVSVDDLQEIMCSPLMVLDHMPDRFDKVIKASREERLRGGFEKYFFDDAPSEGQKYNFPQSLLYGSSKQKSSMSDYTLMGS